VDDDGALQFLDQPVLPIPGRPEINNGLERAVRRFLVLIRVLFFAFFVPADHLGDKNYPVGEVKSAMGNLECGFAGEMLVSALNDVGQQSGAALIAVFQAA